MTPRPDGLLHPEARPAPIDQQVHIGTGMPAPLQHLVERRQPTVNRRSVLPVEFFRRMPGGGTTYAPLGDPGPDPADTP